MRGLKNCIWFVSRPSHSEDFILIPLMVMSQHYTHTAQHRHSVCIYHSQHWLHGPYSGGEPAGGNKTGGPVGSGDTRLISPTVWPPQCSGVLIYGLARPMRWDTRIHTHMHVHMRMYPHTHTYTHSYTNMYAHLGISSYISLYISWL